MANKQPFLQNVWYWWETNDKYVWTWPGQVLEARSININKSSKYFYNANWNLPSPSFEYDLWGSINIRQILMWASFLNRLIFFSDWQIWNIAWLRTTITKNIVNAWVIWTKWFIIYSNWSIDTWTYDETQDDLWIDTLVSNSLTGLTINYYFAPFYISTWRIYLATWSNIYTINATLFTLENTTSLLTGWQVRWITKIWDQFNIYTNYWTSSKQYIWDWNWILVNNQIDWYDRTILNVANVNNVDYVVCDDWLYIANWYQPTCLIQRTFISDYTNAIETYKNKIFIPWYKCVYTYQFNKPWFPWNFSTELILPITTWDQNVSCMTINPKIFDSNTWKYTQDIYIAYLNYYLNNDYRSYIVQYTNDRFLSTRNPIWWNVRLNPIIWLKWTKKASKKLRLWYNLNSSTSTASRGYTYAWVTKQFYFKHSIWIFAEKDEWTKVSCYIWDFTTKPTIWSVYSINGNNSTVTNVGYLFEANSKWHWWIEFEIASTVNLSFLERSITNITKVSWDWDTSWIYIALHIWEIVTLITDSSMCGKSIMYNWDFREITFTIHITEGDLNANNAYENERLQTRVYDFAFLDEDIENDLS